MNEDPTLAQFDRHLTDIVADVERVRAALHASEAPHLVTEDEVIGRLSDVSNLLFELIQAIEGIEALETRELEEVCANSPTKIQLNPDGTWLPID